MPRFRLFFCASFVLVSAAASAANVRLQVEGLSGELEKTFALNYLQYKVMKLRLTDNSAPAWMTPSEMGLRRWGITSRQ